MHSKILTLTLSGEETDIGGGKWQKLNCFDFYLVCFKFVYFKAYDFFTEKKQRKYKYLVKFEGLAVEHFSKMKSSKDSQYIKEIKVEILWLRAVRKPTHLYPLSQNIPSIQLYTPRNILQKNMWLLKNKPISNTVSSHLMLTIGSVTLSKSLYKETLFITG